MGRNRKTVTLADVASKEFMIRTIKNYPEMKAKVGFYEAKRKSLLKLGNFHTEAFNPEMFPNESMLAEPCVPAHEAEALAEYLFALESVYLLEHGIFELEGELADIAKDMFIDRLSREELEEKWRMSQSSISRKRREAINAIALGVQSYFYWKAEKLYMF